MISMRRWLMAVLVMTATAALAACASTIDGSGTFAGAGSQTTTDATQPSGQGPTDQGPTSQGPTATQGPTSLPTVIPTIAPPTIDPTTAPPTTQAPSGSTSGPTKIGQQICDAVSTEQLAKIFKEPAVGKMINSSSCQFTSDHESMIIAVFKDYGDGTFTVTGQKEQDGGGTDLTVAGHPACLTKDSMLVVSRTDNPSTGGIVKAYGVRKPVEQQIANDLMTLIVPHFTMPS